MVAILEGMDGPLVVDGVVLVAPGNIQNISIISLFLFSTSDPLIFRFNGNTYYFFLINGSIRVYET